MSKSRSVAVSRAFEHIYILSTIFFTVYSQLVMRWQVGLAGNLPTDPAGKMGFILTLLLNPWVISGVISTFFAGVSWMLAMTRFEIGYAYPFVSLNYVIVVVASVVLFNESLNPSRLIGTALVILGIIIISKG